MSLVVILAGGYHNVLSTQNSAKSYTMKPNKNSHITDKPFIIKGLSVMWRLFDAIGGIPPYGIMRFFTRASGAVTILRSCRD